MKDAITASLQARFTELVDGAGSWPCQVLAAKSVKLKVAAGGGDGVGGEAGGGPSRVLVASAELEPSEIQDLADAMPRLLEIKAKANLPIRFKVRVELGDGREVPSPEVTSEATGHAAVAAATSSLP